MNTIDQATRRTNNITGLPQKFWAIRNAISYAQGEMTEAEYIELYESASDEYRAEADATIASIKSELAVR